jgi:hypothetical protein
VTQHNACFPHIEPVLNAPQAILQHRVPQFGNELSFLLISYKPTTFGLKMASRRTKAAATDDELGELFEGIGDDKAIKKTTKAKPAAAKAKPDAAEQDILAELENQLGEKAPDRPHTPRVRDAVPKPSPAKRTSTNTPPPAADTARKSAESTASHPTSHTPSATSSEAHESEKKTPAQQTQAASSGGGWWGGLLSTATAAMKQAEAAVKEIQQNEEARKWADQVRGNVGALRGLGLSSPSPCPCHLSSLIPGNR